MTLADLGLPLAVWDTRSEEWLARSWPEASQWATAHIARAGDCFRAEFYMVDCPFAVLRCYAREGQVRCFTDPDTGETAIEAELVVQMLDELPPPHLMGQ